MAVSAEKRELMEERAKPYKEQIEKLKKEITSAKTEARKNKKLLPFFIIKSAMHSIAYSNTCILMSELTEKIQGAKNSTYLNNGRKELSGCISELNKVFGTNLNSSVTENQEFLESLDGLEAQHKLHFFSELQDAITNIKAALGENSKWRWSFPDMHYRFITFSKNWFDFKLLQRSKDPNEPIYKIVHDYLERLMTEAQNTAQEFRSRHELSTQEIDDLYKIRDIFEMQKSTYMLLGNDKASKRLETSLSSIAEKIENIMKKKKQKKGS